MVEKEGLESKDVMLQLLFDFFSGKAKTRIYTTFLGWALICHIDIIFIAIFTDQAILFEKTNLLKGEYVWAYITHYGVMEAIGIEIIRATASLILTIIMIWVLPKHINEKSYAQELKIEYKLRKMKVDKDDELNEREEQAVKKQLENIQTEKQVVVERAKLEASPEQIRWDADFKSFIKTPAYRNIQQVVKTVYEYGGDPNKMLFPDRRPSSDLLAFLDVNGIINLNGGKVTFTDKGRYFLRKLDGKRGR